MQRLVITIFRYRDVGEQPGTRAATPDRKLRCRRLHDCLAGPAGELGPQVTHDMEPTRDVVEDLGLIDAERMQLATTGRAAAVRTAWWGMFNDRARQPRGQRCSHRFVAILGRRFRLCGRICLTSLFFLIGKQQFELFDLRSKLLRGLPE